ncbi:hypothetical protein A6S26_10750 [Nostoc sp. ATCC 43529]|nr:hypothetical protein A6S26_10750 [Nostoc sp. ATCC 43529]
MSASGVIRQSSVYILAIVLFIAVLDWVQYILKEAMSNRGMRIIKVRKFSKGRINISWQADSFQMFNFVQNSN